MGRRGQRIGLKRAFCLCALPLALAFGAFAADAAKPKKVDTKAGDLFVDTDSVSGTISSGRHECKSARKVKLRLASSGKLVSSAKTNKRGDWTIAIELSGGSYYAEVPKATKKSKKGASFQCSAAKTKTVNL